MSCLIADCERPIYVKSRGWCVVHYNRWRRWGDPTAWRKSPKVTSVERLLERTRVDGGCLIWTSTLNKQGYGVVGVGGRGGRTHLAHRLMYELAVEPIADGLVTHHDCHRPACINPEHIRLVTRQEHPGIHAVEGWTR